MNNITNSILTATNKSAHTTQLFLRIWFGFIEPNIVFMGIISNALVLIVMPRQGVTIGVSAKIYYLTIGVSDFIDLIDSWLIYTTINDTMYALKYFCFYLIIN